MGHVAGVQPTGRIRPVEGPPHIGYVYKPGDAHFDDSIAITHAMVQQTIAAPKDFAFIDNHLPPETYLTAPQRVFLWGAEEAMHSIQRRRDEDWFAGCKAKYSNKPDDPGYLKNPLEAEITPLYERAIRDFGFDLSKAGFIGRM